MEVVDLGKRAFQRVFVREVGVDTDRERTVQSLRLKNECPGDEAIRLPETNRIRSEHRIKNRGSGDGTYAEPTKDGPTFD